MIINFEDKTPKIDKSSFIADNAMVIGDVTIGKNVGIWYNAVLRGDVAPITIGDNTSIQDGSVIHCDVDIPTIVGENVTLESIAISEDGFSWSPESTITKRIGE